MTNNREIFELFYNFYYNNSSLPWYEFVFSDEFGDVTNAICQYFKVTDPHQIPDYTNWIESLQMLADMPLF